LQSTSVREILHHPTPIQRALWPTPARAVDAPTIEAGAYMRGLVKTVRDAELTLLKKIGKTKGGGGGGPLFDPKKTRAVRVYVATRFPEWQDACVQAVRAAWAPDAGCVDDAKVRAVLAERGLIKDKRAMPFVGLFTVRYVARSFPGPPHTHTHSLSAFLFFCVWRRC
jgi:leucyl-tRNA synthetase